MTTLTPLCDIFNLGSSYFHIPLTNVRQLLNVTNETTHANQCGANMCLGKIWLAYTLDSQHSVSVERRHDSQYATGQGVPDFQ